MEQVYLKLPRDMLIVAQDIARDRDMTVGQLVRSLLSSEISLRNSPDKPHFAPLRTRLAPHVADATGWDNLQNRLHNTGHALHPEGAGLALHTHPGGTRLCDMSELGFDNSQLIARFEYRFPGEVPSSIANGLPPVEGEFVLITP